jgi:hypothetical protein
MVFGRLKALEPAAARAFGDVEAEHQLETSRLRSLSRAALAPRP